MRLSDATWIATYKDVAEENRPKTLEEVELKHFKNGLQDYIKKADLIMYVSQDNRCKILRNRFGSTGLVKE